MKLLTESVTKAVSMLLSFVMIISMFTIFRRRYRRRRSALTF